MTTKAREDEYEYYKVNKEFDLFGKKYLVDDLIKVKLGSEETVEEWIVSKLCSINYLYEVNENGNDD